VSELASHELLVDGERMHVLDEASLGMLVQDPSLARGPLDSWIQWTAQQVLSHREFCLAWHTLGGRPTRSWIVLLHMYDRWIRIHWEHLVCPRCQIRALAANPTVPDLHVGASDIQATREESWSWPAVPCPSCGSAFDRRAIWAEVEASASGTPGS